MQQTGKSGSNLRPRIQLLDLFSPVSQGVNAEGRVWTLASPWSYLHRIGNVLALALLLFFALFFRGSDGIGLGIVGSLILFAVLLGALILFQYVVLTFGQYDWEVEQEELSTDETSLSSTTVLLSVEEEEADWQQWRREYLALEQERDTGFAGQEKKLKPEAERVPGPAELVIRKRFRNWIPGMNEFETVGGEWDVTLAPAPRRLMNWLLILLLWVPIVLYTWAREHWLWMYVAFGIILLLAVGAQLLLIRSTSKHPNWYEVHPAGTLPYAKHLKEKREKQEAKRQQKQRNNQK